MCANAEDGNVFGTFLNEPLNTMEPFHECHLDAIDGFPERLTLTQAIHCLTTCFRDIKEDRDFHEDPENVKAFYGDESEFEEKCNSPLKGQIIAMREFWKFIEQQECLMDLHQVSCVITKGASGLNYVREPPNSVLKPRTTPKKEKEGKNKKGGKGGKGKGKGNKKDEEEVSEEANKGDGSDASAAEFNKKALRFSVLN